MRRERESPSAPRQNFDGRRKPGSHRWRRRYGLVQNKLQQRQTQMVACHRQCALTTDLVSQSGSTLVQLNEALTAQSRCPDPFIACWNTNSWTTCRRWTNNVRPVVKNHTSNGSWCIGIKGEMSGTVCVTFTWDIYIYIWVVYSFCLFCCLFIIVTWW